MPLSVPRAPLLATVALAVVLTCPSAHAFNGFGRTVEILPTVYEPTILAVPTTSYVTTSYLTPTRYSSVLYPTIYTSSILSPTSYVVPTSYVTSSSYVVPTVFRSRWRSAWRPLFRTSRSYAYDLTPTRYVWSTYWPTTTTLDVPLVVPTTSIASASDCCVEQASASVVSSPAPASPAPRANSSSAPAPAAVNPRPPASLDSQPTNGQANEPAPLIPDGPAPPAPARGETPGFEPGLDFPGQPTPEKSGAPVDAQGLPPISPPAGTEVGPGAGDGSRSSYRPAATDMKPQPTLGSLGALRGSVISSTGMKPESGVRVVFADSRGRYGDREASSDAEGLFEVTLPDGDWLVSVEDAQGKLTPYGSVTVASGRFFDERGRVVSSLRLHH